MSNHAINWARRQTCGSSGAKFVLVTLADYADEANSCWPGQEALAAECEMAVRTVRRHLEELEERGLITRQHRTRQTGRGRTSDRYTLAAPLPDRQRPTGQGGREEPGNHDTDQPDTLTARSDDQPDTLAGSSDDQPDTMAARSPATNRTDRHDQPDKMTGAPPTGAEPPGNPQGSETSTSSRSHVAASCDDDRHLLHLEDAQGAVVEDVRLCDDARSFEALWLRYPRHPASGRLGGGGDKQLARDRWQRLPISQRRLALERLAWYREDLAATGHAPKHIERYISRRYWDNLDGPPASGSDGLDDLELAVAETCTIDVSQLTGQARGELVTAASALEAAGAEPPVVREVARRWRKQYRDIPVTPAVLVRHWHRFAPQVTAGGARSSGPLCPRCKQRKDTDRHTSQRCAEVAALIGGDG